MRALKASTPSSGQTLNVLAGLCQASQDPATVLLTRLSILFLSGAVTALGIVALVEARRHGGDALGGRADWELGLQLAAGLGLWAAGVSVIMRRASWTPGTLLALSGPALFLAELPMPTAGGALLFTAALAGGAAASTLAAAGALMHNRSLRWRPDGAVATVALTTVCVWLGLLATVTFEPSATGCFACPANLFLVDGTVRLHDDLVHGGLYAAAASAAALALLVVFRWAQTAVPARWTIAPVAVSGAASAALAGAAFAHEARAGTPLLDSTTHALWLAQCVCLGLLAAGIAVEAIRSRLLSRRITRLVVDAFPSPERLRAALATSIGDPGLSIVFPRRDGTPVDGDGRPVGPPERGGAVTDVKRGSEVVAQLRHSPEPAQMAGRLETAARSAGLALEHASSRARLRSELAELTASRSRIVEIGDAERRRLERDLHDGAQQRLIALSVALQRTSGGGAAVTRARDEILAALDELRTLAHGIYPASLTDAGLGAALRELADNARVPLRLDLLPPDRVAPPLETAAYRLVLDAVHCAERRGDGRPVSVAVEQRSGSLEVRVDLPGVDETTALLGLEHAVDRVAALAGSTVVGRTDDGVRVDAEMPCAS